MEKYYKVSGDDLKYFIECRARLEALESGGVDNWSWYGESNHNYLQDMAEEYKITDRCITFEDVVDKEIKNFEEIK